MRKRSGCLSRLLSTCIILCIIGAAGLGYLGYKKANDAEVAAIPVSDLRSTYIGDAEISSNTALWEDIIAYAVDDSEIIKEITAALGDTTISDMIVKNYYLADDDTVSTAIAQKILAYRLSKTYSDEELLYIFSAVMNYAPMTAANSTSHPGTDILADILEYLTEQNLISSDTAAEIKSYIK